MEKVANRRLAAGAFAQASVGLAWESGQVEL